eukprot:scaffold4667_cov64-Cylindrotheca_fusiformis.AAC.1
MDPKRTGPYTIVQCHTNGTVMIMDQDRVVTERVNLRQRLDLGGECNKARISPVSPRCNKARISPVSPRRWT